MNAAPWGGRVRRSLGRWLLVSVLGCATLVACGGRDGSVGADGGSSHAVDVQTLGSTTAKPTIRSAPERARAALLRAGDVPGGMTETEPPFANTRCIPKRVFRSTAVAVVEAPARQSNGMYVLNTAAVFHDSAAASRAYARYASRENRRCAVRASRAAAMRAAGGSGILSHVEVIRRGPPVTVTRYAVKVLTFGTAVFADEAVVLDGRGVSTVSLVRQSEPVTGAVRAEVISALAGRLSAALR